MLHAQPSALEVRLDGVILGLFARVGDGDNVPQDPRIDIGDDGLCPFPGKELRRRTADARACAGNKRRWALPHSFMSPATWPKIIG